MGEKRGRRRNLKNRRGFRGEGGEKAGGDSERCSGRRKEGERGGVERSWRRGESWRDVCLGGSWKFFFHSHRDGISKIPGQQTNSTGVASRNIEDVPMSQNFKTGF